MRRNSWTFCIRSLNYAPGCLLASNISANASIWECESDARSHERHFQRLGFFLKEDSGLALKNRPSIEALEMSLSTLKMLDTGHYL